MEIEGHKLRDTFTWNKNGNELLFIYLVSSFFWQLAGFHLKKIYACGKR